MHLKIEQLKIKSMLLILFVLTTGIMALTASTKLWRRTEVNTGSDLNVAVSQPPINPPGKPDLTLLPIQIREAGFARRELTGEPGNYEFLIINASRQPDLTLRLQRERAEEIQSFPTQRGKNIRKRFRLHEGIYVLSVVEHPDWFCRLIITNS